MSSPPVKYLRYFDFTTFATNNPEKPLPGASVDQEYNRLKATTDQTIDRLNEIQRDDGKLRDGAITTNSLADGAVTEPKLANLSVSTRTLQDGSVTGPKLAAGSIPPTALQPGSIGSAQLQDGGVQTIDLADGSCTLAKLAPNSVDSSKILDGSVAPSDLSPAVFSAFAPALHTHPESDVVNLIADLALKAPLASPALTGIPTAPTALVGTSTGQLATTQFVNASLSSVGAITEAPNDGALYGRQALGWQLGVKLAGDTMTGPLVVPSLKLGGITAAFPMWKRVGAALAARLADDSGDAPITSADHTPGVNIINSLGSAALRWLKLWAKDGDFSGDVNVAGNGTIGGNLAVAGIITGAGAPPNANMIINGDMRISQAANGGVVYGGAGGNQFPLDRWIFQHSLPNKIIGNRVAAQPTLPGTGFYFYNEVLTSYAVSPSPDYFLLSQKIEGVNIAHLKWGTASALPLTLSFYVVGQVAGNFGGCIANGAQDRTYPFLYTINAANTWEKKIITIPGDQAGVWATDNGVGIHLRFSLGCGTTRQGPPGAWTGAGPYYTAVGEQVFVGFAVGKSMGFSAVKLEVGNVATPFVPDDFAVSLAKCMRYYQQYNFTQFIYAFGCGMATSATIALWTMQYPVIMRGLTSVNFTGTWSVQDGATAFGASSLVASGVNSGGFSIQATVAGGLTTGHAIMLQQSSAAGGAIQLNGEL